MKRTPLFDAHVSLGARMVEFGGWEMPVSYTSIIDEHLMTRSSCGLFDISHMGEILITGSEATECVQHIISNDVNRLIDGKALYAVLVNGQGGVVDDLFVYRFNSQKYMLVVNASNIEKDYEFVTKHSKSFDVSIENKSEYYAKIDIQGPLSESILQKITPYQLSDLKRFHFVESSVDEIPCIISRTGYTAEDGFELYFDSTQSQRVWDKLLEMGGSEIKPVGLGARDTLRIEACYSLYGHELTDEINPYEADVGFVVKLDTDFSGKETLVSLKETYNRKVVAFELVGRGIPREHYDVSKDGKSIGFVTSGTMSPTFKKGLGMAIVDKNQAEVGNEIHIKIRDNLYPATIVDKPIYAYRGGDK